MQLRKLGQTGLTVSALGFGGAAISGDKKGYGFGAISEADAVNLCRICFERGITLFDTAPIYGFGASEQRIGKALQDLRDDVVLVSKGGITWDDQQRVAIDNSPQVIERMLHQSLRDLGTDYLDLYLIHWPDPNVDIRKPMEVLARAKESGKVRHIGLSNSYPDDIDRALEITEVEVLQNELNLLEREKVDVLFPIVREKKLGFMGYGTLDKGILTGRVTATTTFDDYDVRGWAPWWTDADRTPKYRAMERINPLLEKAGNTGLQLALAYVLQYDEVSTALVGVRSRAQLESAVAAVEHHIPQDVIDEAMRIATEAQSAHY